MTKVKRTAAFILSLIMVCCLFAVFAGCSDDGTIKDLQQQIEEMKTQQNSQQDKIDELEQKNGNLINRVDELENENDSLANRVEELEKKNVDLMRRVDELEQQAYVGKFYSLDEAYDKSMITRDDLQTIANYHNNLTNCSEELSNLVETLIKGRAAFDLRNDEKHPVSEASAQGIRIIKYYGEYNGCYAVILENQYVAYPAEEMDEWQEIDGVKIHYTNWLKIVIWGTK